MYCRNCGKEVLKEDNFCKFCGEQLHEKEAKMSLKWFGFFSKVYLPIIIFFNIIIIIPQISNIIEINYFDMPSVLIIILNIILYIIIPIFIYSKLSNSEQIGITMLITFLCLDYFVKCLLTPAYITTQYSENFFIYFILTAIIYSFWFVPNIIYFFKRRNLFIEEK